MKNDMKDIVKQLDKKANIIARKAGYGKATDYRLGVHSRVVERTEPGYYKNTTNERVPFEYIKKFGWKNCRYVHAYTLIELDVRKLTTIEVFTYFSEVLSPLDTLAALETLTSMSNSGITEEPTCSDKPYRRFKLAPRAFMRVYTTHNKLCLDLENSDRKTAPSPS